MPSFVAYNAYCGCAIQVPFLSSPHTAVRERAVRNVETNRRVIHLVAQSWKYADLLVSQSSSTAAKNRNTKWSTGPVQFLSLGRIRKAPCITGRRAQTFGGKHVSGIASTGPKGKTFHIGSQWHGGAKMTVGVFQARNRRILSSDTLRRISLQVLREENRMLVGRMLCVAWTNPTSVEEQDMLTYISRRCNGQQKPGRGNYHVG
jgi:hypothetical protein